MALYRIGDGVRRGATVRAYSRNAGDPVSRPLKVYTLDPTVATHQGAIASIDVPYEPLEPGPVGSLFDVDPRDGDFIYSKADLNDPRVLIRGGIDPSPSNHQFHQQMVYAVAAHLYGTFRSALGRQIAWGFEHPNKDGCTRLRLVPHSAELGANAQYDKAAGEIRFGYYPAPPCAKGRNLPGGPVYTCLSHDIIVHEMTHALIDGLRSHFLEPTGPEVLGFHEGFADLIAVLQHFRYPQIVEAAIRSAGGDLEQAQMLTAVARQFGLTTTGSPFLRSAIHTDSQLRFDAKAEPHCMGAVLVTAVFRAMAASFRRRTQRFAAFLPRDGEPLPDAMAPILAEEASKLAGHFQTMCIRALDYCPPVDLELGEYLRAILTADRDLMPRDEHCYRESLIDGFAEAGIYPFGVSALAEDALVWRAPRRYVGSAEELSFAKLKFAGDPSLAADAEESARQARALGEFITRPENIGEFGIAMPGHPGLNGDEVDAPCIQSVRTSRRAGDNGEVLFDLVAEVTQRRFVRDPQTGYVSPMLGGSTVILGPRGEIRYVISKSVLRQARIERQLAFQRESNLWSAQDGRLVAVDNPLGLVHRRPKGEQP